MCANEPEWFIPDTPEVRRRSLALLAETVRLLSEKDEEA